MARSNAFSSMVTVVAIRTAIPLVVVAAGCAQAPPQPFDTPVTVNYLDRIDDLEDGDDAIPRARFPNWDLVHVQ